MPVVYDRTTKARSIKGPKARQDTPYEVVQFATEDEWQAWAMEAMKTGDVLARFKCPGDAFLHAHAVVEPCFCVVVRN